MKEVSLPQKMLEHVQEHGDPNTIIPFIIRTHLNAVKKNLAEDHCRYERMNHAVIFSALLVLFLVNVFALPL